MRRKVRVFWAVRVPSGLAGGTPAVPGSESQAGRLCHYLRGWIRIFGGGGWCGGRAGRRGGGGRVRGRGDGIGGSDLWRFSLLPRPGRGGRVRRT